MAGRPRKAKSENSDDSVIIVDDGAVVAAPHQKSSKSKFLVDTVNSIRQSGGPSAASVGGEEGTMLVCIPCPFAFQYLIQNDGLPLELMLQIVGTEGTCKSGLVAEIGRWFAAEGGYLSLIENESKFSQEWFDSIMGYPDETGEVSYMQRRAHSVEDWQQSLQEEVNRAKKLMLEGNKKLKIAPTDKTFPVLFALDSIMGKLTDESQEKIEKEGSAGRGFAIEALSITRFLKKFPQDLHDWPMAFVAVNHLKPQKAEGGFHTERNKAGGRHISFQESFEIEMSRDKGSRQRQVSEGETLDRGGNRLILSCKKNSFGETDRPPVHVSVVWDYKIADNGQLRQYTYWNWGGATVDLLLSFNEGSRMQKIKSVVDVNKLSGGNYWSDRLKVPKTDPVSKTELGQLIEADPILLSELQKLFAIKKRTVFRGGDNYDNVLAKVRAAAEKRMNEL